MNMNGLSGFFRFQSLRLSFKFTLVLGLLLAVVTAISGYIIVQLERQALSNTLESSLEVVNQITADQISRSKASVKFNAGQLSKLMAAIAPQPIAEFDLSLLSQYASMAVEDPDIAYVAFLNSDGKPFAESGDRAKAETLLNRKIVQEEVPLGEVIVGYSFQRFNEQQTAIKAMQEESMSAMRDAQDDALATSAMSSIALFTASTILTILGVIIFVRVVITTPLAHLVNAARSLGEGNLNTHVDHSGEDELAELAKAFNEMATHFRDIIVNLVDTASNLTASAENLATVTDVTAKGVIKQQMETEMVASAMNEMSSTVSEVASNASQAATHANDASTQAVAGKTVVNDTISSIGVMAEKVEKSADVVRELEEHTVSIGQVIDVIKGITEQTNLLALNAAIEAARAGEQGRGFAVVADEVRKLAKRTQDSTAEIHQIIESVQNGAVLAVSVMGEGQEAVKQSVEQASQAGTSLESITDAVTSITQMTVQIASAVDQQSSVTEEMSRNIVTISNVASETAKGSEQIAKESESLKNLSRELEGVIRRFSI